MKWPWLVLWGRVMAASGDEAEGTAGARGAFEFFATSLSNELPLQSPAKKSCDETSAAPKPVAAGFHGSVRFHVKPEGLCVGE